MSPPWRAAALTAAFALALGAATGRQLLDSMNDADEDVLAALAEHADPEPPPAPAGGPRSPRLVIAVIDGLGEDTLLAEAPGAGIAPDHWHFRATVDAGTPSLSKPVYHVLLTGVPQAVSGIRNNSYSGRARAAGLPESVRRSGGTVEWALETVPWFHDLFGAPEDGSERIRDEPFLDGVLDRPAIAAPDRDPFPAMTRAVRANPTLAVLHYTATDGAGHAHGADSAPYRAAARQALAHLRALRDSHSSTPAGAGTVWMIGADHGHLPRGGHGGPELAVRRTAWIGLWPGEVTRRVEIPGLVPADRLAATFAAILEVSPPPTALGDPLDLPDRPTAASPFADARRTAVQAVLDRKLQDAHRGMAARAAALATALLAIGIVLLRRGRARLLLGALAPVLGACLAFLVLGPGATLSAIRTHAGFLSQSTAAMALGAALLSPLARRWHVPSTWVFGAAAALPATALAVTAGSMARSHAPESVQLLLPTTGLVPLGVITGTLMAGALARLFARRRTGDS